MVTNATKIFLIDSTYPIFGNANIIKGNYYNLYDADYEKWTKCFKKYATLLDILLGVCKFTWYTAYFSIISSKLAHTEVYIQ